jgi:hypothetical protein
MAETGDIDVTPEWRFVTIGRGSFASVSVLTGHPIAFKHVILPERSQELRREFDTLRSIYDSYDTDSFFAIPRPLAFYDPSVSASFVAPPRSPYSTIRRRPRVTEGDFKMLKLDTAAYAMDHVSPLPLTVADTIRKLFYPPNSSAARPPSLCRVYFGKVISEVGKDGRPNRFFNSANFPLDVERYRMIKKLDHADDCGYPDVQEIVFGMGEMLGHLHWRAGYDARDVEFVMGGASFSGVALFVIDFNQVRRYSMSLYILMTNALLDAHLEKDQRRNTDPC